MIASADNPPASEIENYVEVISQIVEGSETHPQAKAHYRTSLEFFNQLPEEEKSAYAKFVLEAYRSDAAQGGFQGLLERAGQDRAPEFLRPIIKQELIDSGYIDGIIYTQEEFDIFYEALRRGMENPKERAGIIQGGQSDTVKSLPMYITFQQEEIERNRLLEEREQLEAEGEQLEAEGEAGEKAISSGEQLIDALNDLEN